MPRIVTTSAVNIRSGPAMAFEIVGSAKQGTAYDSSEYRKDGGNVGWYKVGDLGWICAEYVSLAKDIPETENITFNLQRFAPGDDPETKDVTVESGTMETSSSDVETGDMNTTTDIATEFLNDLYLKRRIFGLPYQFLPNVDLRLNGTPDADLGFAYKEALTETPMLSVIPGKPLFLPDMSDDDRTTFVKAVGDAFGGESVPERLFKAAGESISDGNWDVKYFSFERDWAGFVKYFNTLCWMYAIFLGIADEPVPGAVESGNGGGTTFGSYRWELWYCSNLFSGREPMNGNGESAVKSYGGGLSDTAEDGGEVASETATSIYEQISNLFSTGEVENPLSSLVDTMSPEPAYTHFYINPNISYSETFSNDTKASMLEGLMSGASELAKEIAFITAAGAPSADLRSSQTELANQINAAASELTGSGGAGGVLGRVLGGATTIISGANMAFPQMWASSSFSKSFNIEIPLKAAYGTKQSIFMDIIVPMCYWIALTAPRQLTVNTYSAPFLVKCFVPGFFAVDMGIVKSLTISKGGNGDAWSVDGLPLEVNLSISIDDLYETMFQSQINNVSFTDAYNFLFNTALIDYVAVNSGLNLMQSEWEVKLNLAKNLVDNAIGGIGVTISNQLRETFSKSWLGRSSIFRTP